jgi:hypothetical protein
VGSPTDRIQAFVAWDYVHASICLLISCGSDADGLPRPELRAI